MASHDRGRTVAFGLQLAQAHQELRHQIRQLQRGLGQRRSDNAALVSHCLAFCGALTAHHRGEDTGLFAELLRERPDLAGTISKLVEDHDAIASILARVAELAETAAGSRAAELAAIARELDGLASIMESHFTYEERALREALDRPIPDTGWSDMVFRFRDPMR